MKNAIKKISLSHIDKACYAVALQSWQAFMVWLRAQENDENILKCLAFEIEHECRPAFLDRLRTRYNTLRSKRELEELEELTGKIISLNSRK